MNAQRLGLVGLFVLSTACATAPAEQAQTEDLKQAKVKVAEIDLVSDRPGAATLDKNLVNPWGIAFNPAGPVWIANNHSGTTTVYDDAGALLLTATLPAAKGSTGPAAPTGQVFNEASSDFKGDQFVFDGEDGRVYGWKPTLGAKARADFSASGAIYKGLAIASNENGDQHLYLTDFHNGKVTVLDRNYQPVTLTGSFADPAIPAGYAPFNAQELEGEIYVTFAKQDANAEDDDHAPGRGYVDVFDTEGQLIRRLVSRGVLNSPWGLAIAPDSFGSLAGMLLVGNFGDGKINVFDVHASNGKGGEKVVSKGALATKAKHTLAIDGLWALAVGPDGDLYFTAGSNGEDNGLFGKLDVAN